MLFGCRDGACGACMVKIVNGAENISPIMAAFSPRSALMLGAAMPITLRSR
ncbi:MAG: 2Fe-2S iron-sulfur cluster binding domain-containing protein [Proteobacteria bacterium]|nr:MAG: 2Fe-2S iron-sulfur cluster binding domain-containing protein [Pseudomonadota bacterium]